MEIKHDKNSELNCVYNFIRKACDGLQSTKHYSADQFKNTIR